MSVIAAALCTAGVVIYLDPAVHDGHFGRALAAGSSRGEVADAPLAAHSALASAALAFVAESVVLPAYPHAPPARGTGWVSEQRPFAGGDERTLTSAAFEAIRVTSTNPPTQSASLPSPCGPELASRLVVAIALGVHSGGLPFVLSLSDPMTRELVVDVNFDALPLFNTLVASWLPTMQPHHEYRCETEEGWGSGRRGASERAAPVTTAPYAVAP